MDAVTPHTMRHAQRLPNGDTKLTCFCDAWWSGPPEEVAEAFRLHMGGQVLCQAAGCLTPALTTWKDGAGKSLDLCEDHGDLLAVGFPLRAGGAS